MQTFSGQRQELLKSYARKEGDTGSPEVQVALLTQRIKHLTAHLSGHKKDHATRRGLLKLVGRRAKLLRYLARSSPERYRKLIESLGLRK